MADGTSDDPTQIYQPAPPPVGPPTEAIPAQAGGPGPSSASGGKGPGGPNGVGNGIGGGAGSGGPNPLVVALVATIAILAVVIVVLLIVTHKSSKPSAATATTTSTSTSSSTTSTSTTVLGTLPPLPTSTTASTTATSAPPTTRSSAGHRAPSPTERDKIVQDSNAGSNPVGPNAVVDQIWISNSDQTWALLHVSPAAGHANDVQPGYQIRNYVNGTWTFVSGGTTGPQCAAGVPNNVRADFADILGACPGA